MKAKIWLNLVLIAALVALSLYLYNESKRDATPQMRITALKREDVARIVIEPRGAPAIRLEKQGRTWRMTEPLKAGTESSQVDRIVDIVAANAKMKIANPDLSQLDLAPAPIRVTLNDQSFAFGRVNDITYEQYVATADGVYVLPPLYGYGIPTDATKLLSRRLLDIDDIPVAFDFGRYKVTRDDKGKWSASGDFAVAKDAPVTQDDFNRWAAEWVLTSALSVAPDRAPGRGGEQITIAFKGGKSLQFRVMQREPEFQLSRVDNSMRYHFGAEVGRRLTDPRVTAKK